MNFLKKILLTAFFAVFILSALSAQTVNWATDIAPILYQHCTSCHRDGGIGHFSLVGYDRAFSKRFQMADATAARKMPPWKADPTYRHYAGENYLEDGDIQKIQNWVLAGAPAGDLALAPADPIYTDGGASLLGTPDDVFQTPSFTIAATEDEYRCFVIPSGLLQTAYLRGMEIIPGNHQAVHHVLVYQDTTGEAAQLDAQTPEPGYVNFGGSGVQSAKLIGAWAPGARQALLPPSIGFRIAAGSDIVVQIHYPAGSAGMMDQTTLNFFYTPSNQGIREVSAAPAINHGPTSLENFPLFLPAGTTKTYHAKYKTLGTGSILAVAPHMHLIGQNLVCFGVTPQGDTIPFVRINDWDFHWQGSYYLQKPQKLPAGTWIHAYATYDNTSNNDQNPSDPPQLVTMGEATTDEMLLVYFTYMAYKPGDEDIILDSTLLNTNLRPVPETSAFGGIQILPNPVSERAELVFEIVEKTDLQVFICDASGRTLRILAEKHDVLPGVFRETIEVSDLPPGVYFLKIRGEKGFRTERFVRG